MTPPLIIHPSYEETTFKDLTYCWVPSAHELRTIELILQLADAYADPTKSDVHRSSAMFNARSMVGRVYSPFDYVLKQRFNDRLREKVG